VQPSSSVPARSDRRQQATCSLSDEGRSPEVERPRKQIKTTTFPKQVFETYALPPATHLPKSRRRPGVDPTPVL